MALRPEEPEGFAFHEAGHAVAALAVGSCPAGAWINLRATSIGGAVPPQPNRLTPLCWQLAVVLAGPAAQEIARGGQGGFDISGEDLIHARRCLRACPWIGKEQATRAIFGWLQHPDVWAKVDRLALELLRRAEAGDGRGEIAGVDELLRVAWGERIGAGGAKRWGEPLRRAFPPGPAGDSAVERRIREGGGVIPPSPRPRTR